MAVLDDHEIGLALADERAWCDMTQETLATEMRRHGAPHMTRTMIGRIESGQRKLSARELGAAALALNINPCELLMPGAKVRPLDPRIETAEMAEAVIDEIHLVETISELARLLAKMVKSPSDLAHLDRLMKASFEPFNEIIGVRIHEGD